MSGGLSVARADRAREILFVSGQLEIGGTEQHLLAITQGLNRLGWHTAIYSLAGNGPLYDAFANAHVEVILPPRDRGNRPMSFVARIGRLALASLHLLGVLLRRRPAIVHFFLPASYVTGAPLAILARSPIRVMSRRSLNLYQHKKPLFRMLEPLLHRTMTAVLGNSQRVLLDLQAEGVPTERLGLIYNGIDTARFRSEVKRWDTRATLGLAPATLALIIVANLIPYKGHRDLIEALAHARTRLTSDWRLLIVGRDYGIWNDLRVYADSVGIGPNITYLGPRLDVPELLGACDIGLLCSHEEGFSNALLEGMAAGLPMVVTAVGGNAEAVIEGEAGLIVAPGEPKQLAEAIVRLSRDPELRARLGAAGCARVASHFSLEKCVESYSALYEALLAGKLPRDVPGVRVTE